MTHSFSTDTIAQYYSILTHADKIDERARERACTVPLGHCSRTMHRVIEPSPAVQGDDIVRSACKVAAVSAGGLRDAH